MKGIGAYQETAVTTQTRGRLIVLLYEGAIKFLKIAVQEMQNQNWAAKGQYIGKATDIINELSNTLEMDAGGEIAKNLKDIYVFMVRHLNQANMKRDPKMVQEVITLLEELNEGWKTITT